MARMNRIPRWTPAFGPTRPMVHTTDRPTGEVIQFPACPPCSRDDKCRQGRCEADRLYQQARYANAAERLVRHKLLRRNARRADRWIAVLAVIAGVLMVTGAI